MSNDTTHNALTDAAVDLAWGTREVLPAIQKDGFYVQGEEKVVSGDMEEGELRERYMEAFKRKIARLPEGKPATEAPFSQEWVASVVLPAIERDGAYFMGEERLAAGEITKEEFLRGLKREPQTEAGSN